MSTRTFSPATAPLAGEVRVPGDKSLSHRAVLFSAMAEGTTRLKGVLDSADVRSTISAVRALGAHIDLTAGDDGALSGSVTGWGAWGPHATRGERIDCGNSGTTARLLLGVLAGWPCEVVLTGDESLSLRPMLRVTEPLQSMGARFDVSDRGTLPITVHGTASLLPIDYASPVASAQVKTAILLAGLRARGTTRVTEPAPSRDHTERLLPHFGVGVERDVAANAASVTGPAVPTPVDEYVVPRDPSSAAFLVAAAVLVEGSRIVLPGVSLNAARTGFIRVLARMGADIDVIPWPEAESERVGEVVAHATPALAATTIPADEVASLVDEVPILALVASQAVGETRFEGVGELRVKESDRLAAIVGGLTALGAVARAEGDTLLVSGPTRLGGATLDSLGDHRLAMTWAVAGLVADTPVTVEHYDAVVVSYPNFAEDLAKVARQGV